MTLRRTITGDFATFRSLQAEVIAAAERQGFGESQLFEVKLTVEEAFIIAIKRFGSGTRLKVEAELDDDGLKLAVEEAE